VIASHQGNGTVTGVLLDEGQVQKVPLGDYTMNVAFGAPPCAPGARPGAASVGHAARGSAFSF